MLFPVHARAIQLVDYLIEAVMHAVELRTADAHHADLD
jgi:hypothetical protein